MKRAQDGVNVIILGKEFLVACPANEKEELLDAAKYLDKKMKKIHESGKALGAERSAIMAALNISHELLQSQKKGAIPKDMSRKIRALGTKIDAALQTSA